ncbi:hypothetical protein QYE76_038759 [Lolium multiflorum]|uniref:Aminotransferase-like plant mobile domain-containing protein n=1 Tax=Lolium multiflorum TaxID=4521 RepID=A0AAD8WT64_LOLMU|nr:hypothetical protein QYE76_038759 [Lolium multiflorum]
MNAAALTALVDRWRPETHTFHLRAGEMAPTLQDISMILGLPIQGEPLCMNTASDGWRGQMEDLIGRAPPAPANPKERVPAGASFSWIRTNFAQCPDGANEDTRRTYARVYLCWTLVTGSRTGSGGIGGCLLLLSVWSWDRISVGRPRILPERHWPHHPDNPDREPTWAYLWDNVSEMTSDPKIMYRQYTAELDTLTAEQVEWEPYGTYYRIGAGMPDLNHKCMEEARFWRMRCPLICMWLVEHHQPHRVMRQFGLYQECPPQWQDTDKALHRLDRQRQRKITNWPVHHSGHIAAFQHCLEATQTADPVEIVPHDLAAFNNYLQWFHENTRIELVKHAYAEDILDDHIEFDEVAQSRHLCSQREIDFYCFRAELRRSEIQRTADECEIMWDQSGRDEKPVGPLRNFIKNTARKMRRLANLLGCREGEIPTSSSSPEREIPDDEEILSQSIPPKHTSKQAPRSAYQLKPRGNAPNRYTPEDYVNRGKKVVIEEDEGPPRRSSLSRMRNDEPLSSELEKMADPGFHSRADIPDHLREAVDRHISDMFPGEIHNDLRSKLKEMWKTFFTSSMIRTGHVLVDQMRDMVSLLSIELKKQPCACKRKEPETGNVVGGSSVGQKDDGNADTDSDYCIEDCCLEGSGPCTRKGKEPKTENVVGGSSVAQDAEKILEVGGKSVSWHSFYLAMKGGGFMDPSVMDVFLKCVDDGLDFLFIPSSLAHILDVDEADPIHLAASFAEHDLKISARRDCGIYAMRFIWIFKANFYPNVFKADIESFRQFFTGMMLTYDSPEYLASFVREQIEEFKSKYWFVIVNLISPVKSMELT